MALKTKVKVGNITSLSEARYCAGMGVDFLGFPFYNDFQTDFVKFVQITSWVAGPKSVIECLDDRSIKQVLDEKVVADYIQIELLELLAVNTEQLAGYKLFILVPDNPSVEMFEKLYSFSGQGNCVLVSKDCIEKLKHHLAGFELFLEEGEEDYQVSVKEIDSLPIDGIFLDGNEETSPGIQDYGHLSSILEKLEINED